MGYLFLTGATGLLGSYLIRDLTRRGTKLAVLVRATRLATPQHRIEGLIERWEKRAGYALPRPVILEGDLSKPGLGLDQAGFDWVRENCEAVMHNAASLTFHADGPDAEPWRSNLHGTRRVLELARESGIRKFHHVSTAYVCGLRRDRVMENELDVGQQHGNDYEVSKFQAEKTVREAEFLDKPTIYRPGIILGDSQSGYTSTYHGFYVPLKLVATLIDKTAAYSPNRDVILARVRAAGDRLRQVLQLNGQEAKNFVPVDWVSAVMAKIYSRPELHGQTYHLTPRKRVPVQMFQAVMERVFLEFAEKKHAEREKLAVKGDVNWVEFEKMFRDGMDVYRSYWGDDPTFDDTNTRRAAPEFPCPELDEAMFSRMCRYAIESNFGWPRPEVPRIDFNVHEHLRSLASTDAAPETAGNGLLLGLQVNGRGGGQWELSMKGGRVVAARQGLSDRCTATYYLNSNTFQRIARHQITARDAICTGGVLVEGNGVPVEDLTSILQNVAEGRQSAES